MLGQQGWVEIDSVRTKLEYVPGELLPIGCGYDEVWCEGFCRREGLDIIINSPINQCWNNFRTNNADSVFIQSFNTSAYVTC